MQTHRREMWPGNTTDVSQESAVGGEAFEATLWNRGGVYLSLLLSTFFSRPCSSRRMQELNWQLDPLQWRIEFDTEIVMSWDPIKMPF